MNESHAEFILPASVVSKVDVSRIVGELEQIDNERTTAEVREKVGVSDESDIMLSRQLSEFLEQNQLSINTSRERSELIKRLRVLKETVPVIHLTFATPADRESLGKLVQWLRGSLHPLAVIEVGLQPALIAGVSIRTPNHIHDLSMRAMIKEHHGELVKELEALRGNG